MIPPQTAEPQVDPFGGFASPAEARTEEAHKSKSARRQHDKGVARPPPLFARKDAGHVVFRGSEKLEDVEE